MPKAKKQTKATPKTVDENQDLTLVTGVRFKFKKLELKDSYDWLFTVEVKQILPRTYHWLHLSFELDEQPFNKRITELEKELDEAEKNPTIFDEINEKAIKSVNAAIRKVNKELQQARNECKSFDMLVDVQQLKYKDGDTILTVRLADPEIAMIVGKQAHRSRSYLLTIQHRDVNVEGARS